MVGLAPGGSPAELIQSLKGTHVVEQWRRLCAHCHPRCAAQELIDSNWLGSPPKAKGLHDILDVITAWKAKETQFVEAGGARDNPKRRYNILMSMLPASMSHELESKMDTHDTFEKVETWVRQVVHYRQATHGGAARAAFPPYPPRTPQKFPLRAGRPLLE